MQETKKKHFRQESVPRDSPAPAFTNLNIRLSLARKNKSIASRVARLAPLIGGNSSRQTNREYRRNFDQLRPLQTVDSPSPNHFLSAKLVSSLRATRLRESSSTFFVPSPAARTILPGRNAPSSALLDRFRALRKSVERGAPAEERVELAFAAIREMAEERSVFQEGLSCVLIELHKAVFCKVEDFPLLANFQSRPTSEGNSACNQYIRR